MSSKLEKLSCIIVFYCNIYLSSLDTLLIDNDVEVGNTEQRQLTTFTDIFVVPKTVTSKNMLLDRSYIAKKSKAAEKNLKEVYEYLTEKKSKLIAAKMILKEQERERASRSGEEESNGSQKEDEYSNQRLRYRKSRPSNDG